VVSQDGEEHKEAKETLTRRFLNKIHGHDSDSEEDENSSKDLEKGQQGKKESRFSNLEQVMPGDAVLDGDGAERFLKGLEGSPLGIITLEDVLEELIGEEILDEFDLTGAQALPASSFVPEEAKRAVDAAAQARKGGRAKRVAQGLRMVKRTHSTPAMHAKNGELPAQHTTEPTAPNDRPAATDAETEAIVQPAVVTEEAELMPAQTTGDTGAASQPRDGRQTQEQLQARRSLFKSVNTAADTWREGVVGSRRKGVTDPVSGEVSPGARSL